MTAKKSAAVLNIKKELQTYSSQAKAKILMSFFKTGPGEYGEGDIFIGVKVPDIRRVAKKYATSSRGSLTELLRSEIHEERLLALLVLVEQFEKGTDAEKKGIFNYYLKMKRSVNNWDLVDLTAPKIVGAYLLDKDKEPLWDLARSKNLWDRRIAIVATYTFIKHSHLRTTLCLSELLLNDAEDLMHKAVGWMLRELGKKDVLKLELFIKEHYERLPRTLLRYAIERFPEVRRKKILKGEL